MKKLYRPKIDIFSYTDYKQYLQDAYQSLHEQNLKISYRYLQKRAGYSVQSNHFWQVIRGRVSFSRRAAERFGQAMNLTVREIRYLELLASLNGATSDEERNRMVARITQSAGYEKRKSGSQISHEYYSEWYFSALRELVNHEEFAEDPKWIASALKPKITKIKAEKGIKKLIEWGMLVRDDSGKIRQADQLIGGIKNRNDQDAIARLALRNYHRHMIRLGMDSIENFTQSSRLVTGTTMSVSKSQAKRVRKLTEEYFKQVEAIVVEDEPVETLLRLNMQLFPLMNNIKIGKQITKKK